MASAATPFHHSAVRVVQVLPVDGIGGVELAARSALAPVPEMAFALVPIGGAPQIGGPAALLPPRRRSPDDPRAVADAIARVLSFEPDVVIGSLWRSAPVLVALALRRRRPRLVYFLHVESATHLPDRLLSAVGIALADEIWCDSIATQHHRLNPKQRLRSRVISFVTERLAAPEPPPVSPRFVIWARLNRQKGIDRAIRLIAALVARGVDADFKIYGPDGGERQALEQQAQLAGLARHVSFEGAISQGDRRTVASEATFFLQLSRFEGMAMSVVEAMQLGLVPVVCAVGEIARYVRSGENGLVVDPEAPELAADQVIELLRDPRRVLELRGAAINTWRSAKLYREDVAESANALRNAFMSR